jgi:hypothetical protein
MHTPHLTLALENLKTYLKLEREGYKRLRLLNILSDLELGMISAEEAIEEAKMIGVRNPAFDGDMVGWLDDDFEDDEDDEAPSSPKTKNQ